MTGGAGAWSVTRGRPRAYASMPLPAPVGMQLRSALVREHARRPFAPRDVRDAARRSAAIARRLGMVAEVVRGGLDVGGAELDHVWAVADDLVVDVALPINSRSFLVALRAFVAGDLAEDELDRAAHGYSMDQRVVGEYPHNCRYLGLPVFAQRQHGSDVEHVG